MFALLVGMLLKSSFWLMQQFLSRGLFVLSMGLNCQFEYCQFEHEDHQFEHEDNQFEHGDNQFGHEDPVHTPVLYLNSFFSIHVLMIPAV